MKTLALRNHPLSLNPFEVREVLQVNKQPKAYVLLCLNPFEVREVLQDQASPFTPEAEVSIPLKSGRCCKFWAYVDKYIRCVSIPLKSGRCCKVKG